MPYTCNVVSTHDHHRHPTIAIAIAIPTIITVCVCVCVCVCVIIPRMPWNNIPLPKEETECLQELHSKGEDDGNSWMKTIPGEEQHAPEGLITDTILPSADESSIGCIEIIIVERVVVRGVSAR